MRSKVGRDVFGLDRGGVSGDADGLAVAGDVGDEAAVNGGQ